MSRTPPWGFWHDLELLPTLGNQKSHRATGWGQPSHPCADTAKDRQGDLELLGKSLWDWMGMWDLGGCDVGWHLDHRVGMVARQEVKG